MMDFSSIVSRLTEPLRRKVSNMVKKCVVTLVNDSFKMQTMQLTGLKGETLSGVEHYTPYGFAHNPLSGAEAVCVSPAGNTSGAVSIVVADRRFRLKPLASGEVALFTDEGDKLHFKRGKEISIETRKLIVNASEKIQMTAPNIEMNASASVNANTPTVNASTKVVAGDDITAGGNIESAGEIRAAGTFHQSYGTGNVVSMADFIAKYNNHKHNENNPDGPETDATQGSYKI